MRINLPPTKPSGPAYDVEDPDWIFRPKDFKQSCQQFYLVCIKIFCNFNKVILISTTYVPASAGLNFISLCEHDRRKKNFVLFLAFFRICVNKYFLFHKTYNIKSSTSKYYFKFAALYLTDELFLEKFCCLCLDFAIRRYILTALS